MDLQELTKKFENDRPFLYETLRVQLGKLGIEAMLIYFINTLEAQQVSVEPEVMQTLKDIKEKREEKTIYLLISTLANMMCAKEDIIIDLLSGYLWSEEEGNKLKRSV